MYYITKHALTLGIIALEDYEASEGPHGWLDVKTRAQPIEPKDWTKSLVLAHKRAEQLKQRKIATLKKQLERFQGLSPAVVRPEDIPHSHLRDGEWDGSRKPYSSEGEY